MENKYIITLEEMPFERFHSYNVPSGRLYRVQGFNSLVFDGNGLSKLTPYKEPNLEAIRNEAYEKGYQDAIMKIGSNEQAIAEKAYQGGLVDAWETVRKIADLPTVEERENIFACAFTNDVIRLYTATEAIEKIRQYEQEQEEIKVGDEVQHKCCNRIKIVVLNKESDVITGIAIEDVPYACKVGEMYINRDVKDWEKTGKHYEIAEVLRKLREKEL